MEVRIPMKNFRSAYYPRLFEAVVAPIETLEDFDIWSPPHLVDFMERENVSTKRGNATKEELKIFAC